MSRAAPALWRSWGAGTAQPQHSVCHLPPRLWMGPGRSPCCPSAPFCPGPAGCAGLGGVEAQAVEREPWTGLPAVRGPRGPARGGWAPQGCPGAGPGLLGLGEPGAGACLAGGRGPDTQPRHPLLQIWEQSAQNDPRRPSCPHRPESWVVPGSWPVPQSQCSPQPRGHRERTDLRASCYGSCFRPPARRRLRPGSCWAPRGPRFSTPAPLASFLTVSRSDLAWPRPRKSHQRPSPRGSWF